ncbi:arginine/ornithine transport system permease protein [Rubricella aquisinus]|uniref:Arginine/ornithine transport system permease protein n=1 Tax=Rubricella aquisinus TaxID=2028108 RepID=A0A840WL70_9RHOB|nr:ABC transporter permease [Rubricella aquisinus]MBB5515271.1 arginine/ornithine transport system permease protein [Rubricella aquisinus]
MRVDLVLANWELFLGGVWMTVQLTGLALLIGFCIAIPFGIIRANKVPVWSQLINAYVYAFRGTPLLVQLFLIYFGLAQFDFVRESWAWVFLRDAWWCALIAFALNSGAYATEIIRGAVATTPKGEIEGARALGLSRWQVYALVLLPSALRRALPQYGNEVVFMLHGSAVASIITIQDILGAGRTLNARYYVAYEGFLTAALLYMAITFLLVMIFRQLERRYLRHLALR